MIEIAFLADYREAIAVLSQWFRAQWPAYYAGRTQVDVAQDFVAEANRSGTPVRLLAFVDGQLAGTITLRETATSILPAYHPGLGGLFVPEQYRGQGIATALVQAGMNLAQAQGFTRVYATTMAARGILTRLGWQQVPIVVPNDNHGLLYQYEF